MLELENIIIIKKIIRIGQITLLKNAGIGEKVRNMYVCIYVNKNYSYFACCIFTMYYFWIVILSCLKLCLQCTINTLYSYFLAYKSHFADKPILNKRLDASKNGFCIKNFVIEAVFKKLVFHKNYKIKILLSSSFMIQYDGIL